MELVFLTGLLFFVQLGLAGGLDRDRKVTGLFKEPESGVRLVLLSMSMESMKGPNRSVKFRRKL